MLTPDEWGTYTRVSTEKQSVNTSPQRQLEENQSWAKKNLGFEIPNVFQEPGRTGANLDERPVMSQVLHLVETRQLKGVVFNTLDRTARNLDILFRIRWIFLEADARGFCVHEKLDITTREFQELVGILVYGLKAQMELDDITRRLLGGRERRVKQGEAAGGGIVPYGFNKTRQPMPDGHMGVFYELDPNEVQICQLIRDWFIDERLSRRKISTRLNKWGIPSASASRRQKKGRWWPGIVGKILTDPKYRGELVWGEYTTPVDRIFSEEDAWRIDRQIAENAQVYSHVRIYQYLLTGLLKCGLCGYTFTGSTSTYNNRPYSYYRCVVKQRIMQSDKLCNSTTLKKVEVERVVWEDVKRLILDTNAINDLADGQRLSIEEDVERETQALQGEIARIETEQDRLIMMAVRDELKHKRVQHLLDEKDQEMAGKRAMLARYQDRQKQRERREQGLRHAQQRMAIWREMVNDPDLAFELKREIVRGVIEKVVVLDENSLQPYYNLMGPTLIDNHNVLTMKSPVKGKVISY